MKAALTQQWCLSNIAHPRGLSLRLAQGFSGRSVDEMQSQRDGGKQSTLQRLSAAFCADPRPAITKARSSQNCAILLSCAAISDLF
jgi:hypothetical protein